jgi:hypothetical protein
MEIVKREVAIIRCPRAGIMGFQSAEPDAAGEVPGLARSPSSVNWRCTAEVSSR